jgi:hypothetical protein
MKMLVAICDDFLDKEEDEDKESDQEAFQSVCNIDVYIGPRDCDHDSFSLFYVFSLVLALTEFSSYRKYLCHKLVLLGKDHLLYSKSFRCCHLPVHLTNSNDAMDVDLIHDPG